MSEEFFNWQMTCDRFAMDGDTRGMRACAKEVRALVSTTTSAGAEAAAMEAGAALLAGDAAEAERLAQQAVTHEPAHFRGRLVLAGALGARFALAEELPLLEALIRDLERALLPTDGHAEDGRDQEKWARHLRHFLFCARGLEADAAYLAADPERAAAALQSASALAPDLGQTASLYSKYLFMTNYRRRAPKQQRQDALMFNEFFRGVHPYQNDGVRRVPDKRLRIGYISRDFRLHAMAYFLMPFLRDFDPAQFAVYVYDSGPVDDVTRRFQRCHVTWRDFRGRSAHTAARIIAEDHIDILVDFSGHSQDNALPVLAYHAAPIQLTGLGYVATTGLSAIDGLLVDQVTLPRGADDSALVEPAVRLPQLFCYQPGAVREMPQVTGLSPYAKNEFVTFGSFNNLAKLSDETLLLWRAILDDVPKSRLVLKGKTLSVEDGRELITERLRGLQFPIDRIELRPFSEHYLEEYQDIDIALDTTPYTGGLTTCEALYMGVPVVTLRGQSHGARFGASLLTAAGLPELIAENEMEYVKLAVGLARHPEHLALNRQRLRVHLEQSNLMNAKAYMRGVEGVYRDLWRMFCKA
ncbi:hypothetical protein [uncultured Selenomonas sp.]|uniref:O-linked N-acetylglucosamine transferase, SPINDLY family protein n=1 Tax=uncultured Selenomonas sp. TaxID=159275 RepID=UPI0025FEE7C2|nr:hypothetical protein [uncultured Selenomonas sp.]